MKCPICNTENKQDAKKCISCKSKLTLDGVSLIAIICILGLTTFMIFALLFNEDEGSEIHGAIHRIEYGENVVYLFGTMHAAAPEWFPLADVVEDAMARADVFAFETDWTSEGPHATLDYLAESGEGTQLVGETLVDVMPANAHDNLVRYIETYELTYEDVYQMNPVALSMTINTTAIMEFLAEFGIRSDISVDSYIFDFAQQRMRPIIGLEPMLQQMRIAFAPDQEILDQAGFTGTLEEIFYDALVDFMPHDELLAYLYDNMELHYDYLDNDIEGVIASMEVSSEELENTYMRYMVEVVMNFRSTYYANSIASLLRETEEPTTFFAAVGLSHVIREGDHLTNIVEQLELLGITAEPIWQ